LGHLGVQYARAMGALTVAISTSSAKESLAKELGAHHYIDTSKQDAAAELKKLGGANVILATVYDAKAQSALIRMSCSNQSSSSSSLRK
jgi:D-arabinose 1-dehydrogenase-like Zn-dependent alcohol dehydrogenase